MSFTNLGLSEPILKAIKHVGYTTPTAIQEKAIPAILKGEDIIAAAPTGTGKTASFVLPLLEQLHSKHHNHKLRGKRIRAVIITPTRELAKQIEHNIRQYGQYTAVSSMTLFGGVDSEAQKQRLIEGVDIVVATPGRLLDMLHQRALYFDELESFILDEADKMLDMGFINEIDSIVARLPNKRQSLLFSATLSTDVRALADMVYDDALEISIDSNNKNASTIKQQLIAVDKDQKSALLSHLINQQQWQQALIFVEKKHSAAKLASQLEKRGIIAEAIHGDKSQANRERILADFSAGRLRFLVATGIAARGIDVQALARVINYDLPFKPDDYIHRIGRTGRAGNTGTALSFVALADFKNLCAIESRLGHLIERIKIEGFTPRKAVPISILNYVPKNQR